MNRKTIVTVLIGAAVVLGVAVAGWRFVVAKKSSTAARTAAESGRKILYWADPMVPGYRSDKPGKSPFMDMDLVPVYEDGAGASAAPIVTIRPEIINNLGVRTYRITRGGMTRSLAAQGYLFREGGNLLVLVDIFERDMTWVRAGLPVEVRIPDLPGRTWDGTVESVRSDVDIGARSMKLRVRIRKPDAALTPNLFADIIIKGASHGEQKIMVPREALIRTGFRTAVVLGLGQGRFQPVDVVPGEESGDWIEIRKGVKEGDTVVVSGQFLIDSEASVRASFQRMETKPPESPPGPEGKKQP